MESSVPFFLRGTLVSCLLCFCLGEAFVNDASAVALRSGQVHPVHKQRDVSQNATVQLDSSRIQDEARAIEAISGSRVPGTIEHLLMRPLDADTAHQHMSIALLYPSFGRADVDSDIRQWVTEIADAFERNFEFTHLRAEIGEGDVNDPIELQADYTISRPSKKAISITFHLWNHVGGPHANLDVITLNYSLLNGQRLGFSDIFGSPDTALTLLSKCSRSTLQQRYGLGRTQMLLRGTEPLVENFSSITLTPTGILVHFQPYQVAGWEMGVQTVAISLEELAPAKPFLVYWGR